MSCAISPIAMAHQWRRPVCAITIGALGKTNGAKRAPLGFFQWSANGAMALSRGLAGHNPAPYKRGWHSESRYHPPPRLSKDRPCGAPSPLEVAALVRRTARKRIWMVGFGYRS
jgi:hypothetical protein